MMPLTNLENKYYSILKMSYVYNWIFGSDTNSEDVVEDNNIDENVGDVEEVASDSEEELSEVEEVTSDVEDVTNVIEEVVNNVEEINSEPKQYALHLMKISSTNDILYSTPVFIHEFGQFTAKNSIVGVDYNIVINNKIYSNTLNGGVISHISNESDVYRLDLVEFNKKSEPEFVKEIVRLNIPDTYEIDVNLVAYKYGGTFEIYKMLTDKITS